MAINIQAKPDVSYLFSSLGTNTSNAASSNFLLQYASIKNGSYGKLLKAYYSETASDSVKSLVNNTKKTNTVTAEDAKALAEVQSATDDLKESADALLESGKDSVFNMKEITTKDENGVETTTKGYDTEAIYNAVNNFVKDYNSVIDAANAVEDEGIIKKATNMVESTISNAKLLNQIGITINEDSTLSIDKETFQKADVSKVKNLFNSTGSYGYGMSVKASMINFAADRAASKASTYTVNGTYNNTYNTGNIFDTLF